MQPHPPSAARTAGATPAGAEPGPWGVPARGWSTNGGGNRAEAMGGVHNEIFLDGVSQVWPRGHSWRSCQAVVVQPAFKEPTLHAVTMP
jgi:hypothetical protein